jgi:hypothetical protein
VILTTPAPIAKRRRVIEDDEPIVSEKRQREITAARQERRVMGDDDEPIVRVPSGDDESEGESEDEEPDDAVVAVRSVGGRMSRPDDLLDVCHYYRTTRLGEAEIRLGRERVAREWGVGRSANFQQLSAADLDRLFALYDEQFFANSFRRSFVAAGHELEMMPTAMLSRTAGRCAYDPSRLKHRCTYTIEIATRILRDAFGPDRPTRPVYAVGGLLCRSRLECMQLTLEHEMVHLLMFVWKECSDGARLGGHGRTFKLLARNIFGHTETKHGLMTPLDEGEPGSARERIQRAKARLFVGAGVELQGQQYTVSRLNRTKFQATRSDGRVFNISYLSRFTVAAGQAARAPAARAPAPHGATRPRLGTQVSVTGKGGKTFTGTVVQLNPKTVYARDASGRTAAIPYSMLA